MNFGHQRVTPRSRLFACFTLAVCAAIVMALATFQGRAQEDESKRIIDREPFDRLTLNKANENKVLIIRPAKLPNRRIPEKPKANEKLRIQVIGDPAEYEVAWLDVDKLELYEQMVLAEANELARAGKFDEAYEYFVFLLRNYPNTLGLKESQHTYLYLSSGAAFREQKFDEALAIVEELMGQNPNYRASESSPPLLSVLGNIADKLVAAYVEKEDYRSARTLLLRLAKQYQAEAEPFFVQWQRELARRANERLMEARAHLEAGRFIEAHDASVAMMRIWPDVAGAEQIAEEVARRHPLVVVGVDQPALDFNSRSLLNPASRRAGRLVERRLLELHGLGDEGGDYVCPLGTTNLSVDGLVLTFQLRPIGSQTEQEVPTGYDIAQRLLAWTREDHPDFSATWARLLAGVRVTGVQRVQADLKYSSVLPEALLQSSYAREPLGEEQATGNGPFTVLRQTPEATRFTSNEKYNLASPGSLAEVLERHFDDPQRALMALTRGEIDVLDRVFPADIAALEAEPNIAVAPYAAPTSHFLVLRSEHPYLANKSFRRALVYGSNRELILDQALLRGKPLPGFRVVSAPFPAATSSSDSAAYGYDQQIEPRPYNPRLALTLKVLSQAEVKASHEKQKLTPPPLAPLTLGHPADELSRIACRALVKQWKQVGIDCSLLEFPPGVFDDTEGKCDLVYVQGAAWEPIVDAERLLGVDGVAPSDNAFVQLTLRQLERASNWQEARDRFRQLHRFLHEDVTVIPLWQTLDHYAYRRSWTTLGDKRVTLYQDVEQWRAAPHLARTEP